MHDPPQDEDFIYSILSEVQETQKVNGVKAAQKPKPFEPLPLRFVNDDVKKANQEDQKLQGMIEDFLVDLKLQTVENPLKGLLNDSSRESLT